MKIREAGAANVKKSDTLHSFASNSTFSRQY